MSLMDKRPWFLSWFVPASWLVVVVLLGAYVGTPARYLEAPTLSWVVTLAVIVVALTHLGVVRHGRLSARGGPPPRARRGGSGPSDGSASGRI
jgi:hypothetical protein